MAEEGSGSDFQFVDWSDISGPSKNAATRVMIRKQAMSKAAAARKERGDWGKKNIARKKVAILPSSKNTKPSLYCGPVSPLAGGDSSNDDGVETTERPAELIAHHDRGKQEQNHSSMCTTIPPKMACSGYELQRLESDFDILDLSALTTFHVGRITTVTLHTSPLLLKEVLQCRQWSYFSYVPSRFGHFPCLDDAARCVASRVRSWTTGEFNANAANLSLYTKALDSLQLAINNPLTRVMPETLCATELLALYEVSSSLDRCLAKLMGFI